MKICIIIIILLNTNLVWNGIVNNMHETLMNFNRKQFEQFYISIFSSTLHICVRFNDQMSKIPAEIAFPLTKVITIRLSSLTKLKAAAETFRQTETREEKKNNKSDKRASSRTHYKILLLQFS